MTTWEHPDAYAASSDLVVRDLSEALFSGERALILGAGISKDFGLPSWPELVRKCFDSVGLPSTAISNNASFEQLIKAAREFHEKCPDIDIYHDTIKRALYPSLHRRDKFDTTPLLVAIGALLMGSRRGSIHEVWTLNYDDVLEWYLRIYGYVSQVITEVPTLMRDSDVIVYHAHGFLPLDERHGNASREIVFDDESYAKRMVGKLQPWRDALQWALRSRVFLAVGLSWSDGLLKNLIFEAKADVTQRPTAFWLFGPNTTDDQIQDCLRNNVVPLRFSNFTDYGPFILRICEDAMKRVN